MENKENKCKYQCNIDIELEQNERIIFGKVNHVDSRLLKYEDGNILAEFNRYNITNLFHPEIINNGKTLMVWGSNTEKNHFPLYYRYSSIKDANTAFNEFGKLIDKINSQNLDTLFVPTVKNIPNKIVENIVVNFNEKVCYQNRLTADNGTNLERVTFDEVKTVYEAVYDETKSGLTIQQRIKVLKSIDKTNPHCSTNLYHSYKVQVFYKPTYISIGCIGNISIKTVQEIYSQIIDFEKKS